MDPGEFTFSGSLLFKEESSMASYISPLCLVWERPKNRGKCPSWKRSWVMWTAQYTSDRGRTDTSLGYAQERDSRFILENIPSQWGRNDDGCAVNHSSTSRPDSAECVLGALGWKIINWKSEALRVWLLRCHWVIAPSWLCSLTLGRIRLPGGSLCVGSNPSLTVLHSITS